MHTRRLLTGSVLLLGALSLIPVLTADETPAKGSASSSGSATSRRGPLPINYGKLGLSDEQRDKLYAVQNSYEERLEKLRNELKELVRERDEKMESMLTDGQKLRLNELRAAARQKAAAGRAKADE